MTAPYREPAPVAPPDPSACWGCGSRERFVSVGMVYCNACGRYQGPAFPIASPLAMLSREVASATLLAARVERVAQDRPARREDAGLPLDVRRVAGDVEDRARVGLRGARSEATGEDLEGHRFTRSRRGHARA